MEFKIDVNGESRSVDVDPTTPLLWVLRDELGLVGTKYSCGVAQCGACTAHLDGTPVRACVTPIKAVGERRVTTIEGVEGPEAEAVQEAWQGLQVPQCGYCQSGQIMSAVALLDSNTSPSDADIDVAMRGNVCRCGAYPRIRRGIRRAATVIRKYGADEEQVNG